MQSGSDAPLKVYAGDRGFCIAANTQSEVWIQESVETWTTRASALQALDSGGWTQRLYAYTGQGYSKVEGKDPVGLHAELKAVYDSYPEYNDVLLGGGDFMQMVSTFANDDFYKLHYVALRYLALEAVSRGERRHRISIKAARPR